MSDFIDNLVHQTLNPESGIQPRLGSYFESANLVQGDSFSESDALLQQNEQTGNPHETEARMTHYAHLVSPDTLPADVETHLSQQAPGVIHDEPHVVNKPLESPVIGRYREVVSPLIFDHQRVKPEPDSIPNLSVRTIQTEPDTLSASPARTIQTVPPIQAVQKTGEPNPESPPVAFKREILQSIPESNYYTPSLSSAKEPETDKKTYRNEQHQHASVSQQQTRPEKPVVLTGQKAVWMQDAGSETRVIQTEHKALPHSTLDRTLSKPLAIQNQNQQVNPAIVVRDINSGNSQEKTQETMLVRTMHTKPLDPAPTLLVKTTPSKNILVPTPVPAMHSPAQQRFQGAESTGESTINIHIGRIEVRASMTPPVVAPRQKSPSKPAMKSLDDYLQKRNEGRNQ